MINVKLNTREGDDEFERMRLFCALRHFPELRTSLAVAGQVDIPEPQSKLKCTYVKPKPNDNFKLGFSNRNAHKVLKNLSTSVLAEVPDQYGPVRSGMRQRREDFRNAQMSHKQSYDTLSRPSSANNEACRSGRPRSPIHKQDLINPIPVEDPLRRVCSKLSRAGISLGQGDFLNTIDVSSEELRREISSSGLLAVLGMPPVLSSAHNTPRHSPRNNNNNAGDITFNSQTLMNTSLKRDVSAYSVRESSYNTHDEGNEEDYYIALLKKRLGVILCIRVDADELSELYEALYILNYR